MNDGFITEDEQDELIQLGNDNGWSAADMAVYLCEKWPPFNQFSRLLPRTVYELAVVDFGKAPAVQ